MRPVLIPWSRAPRSLSRTLLSDRDGVLGAVHLNRPDGPQVTAYEGVTAALERLVPHSVAVVVISNQGAVGRGEHSLESVMDSNERLMTLLDPARELIDYVAMCPHSAEQQCRCRKPLTGAIDTIARYAGSPVGARWMVGDRVSDMELARRLGVPGILVRTGHGRESSRRLRESELAVDVTHVADFATAVAMVVDSL